MLSERAADGGEREPRALFPKRRYGRRGQLDRGNWGTGGVEVVSRSDCWRQRMDHPVSLLHDCTRTTPIIFTPILYSHPHISSSSHSIPFLYPLSRQSATGFLLAPTICQQFASVPGVLCRREQSQPPFLSVIQRYNHSSSSNHR